MTRHPGFDNWKDYILSLEDRAEELQGSELVSAHMEIARLWEDKYLEKAKAILHYQKAFKAEAGNLQALQGAYRLYWEMGRFKPIERLVSLQLQLCDDVAEQVRLYRGLAEAMLLIGETDRVELACMEILERLPGDSWSQGVVDDLGAVDNRLERAQMLADQGEDTNDAELLFRAACLHRLNGSSSEEIEACVSKAAAADPFHRGACIIWEDIMLEAERNDELTLLQKGFVDKAAEDVRAPLAFRIGQRWLLRHADPATAMIFFEQAAALDPNLPGLFGFIYDAYLENEEQELTATLLANALERAKGDVRVDVLEAAGYFWGRVLKDVDKAAQFYSELRRVDSDNPLATKFFEENEMTMDESDRDELVEEEEEAVEENSGSTEPEPEAEPEPDPEPEAEVEALSLDANLGIDELQEEWKKAPGHPSIVEAMMACYGAEEKWHPLADFLKKQSNSIDNENFKINALMTLAGLYNDHLNQDVMVVNTYQSVLKVKADHLPAIDAAIEKYKEMSRWPDLVKMLKAKGAVATDPAEKVDIFLDVAKLFLERFSNQAEAIKAFEEVIKADPHHDQAIEFLKEMYEKRRDWEKLINIMASEADGFEGADKTEALISMAELATERLKRPNVCTERWEAVLEVDSENEIALGNLVGLYERTKEWEKLADVLSKQIENISDAGERTAMLQKMGQVYGDKLGNDEKAVEAWKALIEINPDDRRAQDQLKKRYLALQAWDELEEFYAASGKWDEFIRVLEREADKQDVEVEKKISMQFKIAELWRDKKERMDRAARCYQTVLELDNNNLDAAEALVPILEEGKDKNALADVLEVKLNHLEDDGEKLALRQRIAHIAEDEIEDMDRAFEGFYEAFKMLSDDETTQEDLERSAGKAGRWEQVVEIYESKLEEVGLDMKLRLARVLDEEIGKPEDALKFYDGILAEEPKNSRAVNALEKIYAQMGRYEELLDIYTRRLEMAEDDDERKEILYNQALLWEEEVNDSAKAIAVYNQIIEMAGDEQRSLAALDRIYLAEENWSGLGDVIQRELDQGVLEQDEELELKYRLGQVCDLHLNDKSSALECYREIVAVNNEHAQALEALENLLEDESQQNEAAKILGPLYEEIEQWEKLVGATEILVKHCDDDFEKYEYLNKVGGIYSGQLGSVERAFVAYSRAFKTKPTEVEALEQLEQITAILDSWAELVDLLAQGAASVQDQDVAKDLWLRAARIYDTQLDNVDKSVEAYDKALELDPQNEEAIGALEQIYSRIERWDDLVSVLRNKIEITVEADEKEQIFRQMAMILEEMLSKPDEAVSCHKEILALDPNNEDALKALDKLFVELQNWTDLADNLQQQLNLCGDSQMEVTLKLRLAEIKETQLEEIDAAIEIYREVLDVDAENETAITALEKILENADFRRQVADILEPIYRTLMVWEKLVSIYEIMIEEEHDARKVELLHEISNLYETAGDEPEKAFKTLGRALEIEPSDERTQEELERLARVLVLHDDLAALYAKTVENIDNGDLAGAYHMKIAQIFGEQIQDVDNSIKHYRKVLEVDPMHIEAATALEAAYQINEDYDELANTYLRKVEMVTDPDEQKQLLFNASKIYEEILEKSDKAIEVYNRVLEIDEDDLEAINHLEVIYLTKERWEDLQEIYNRKVDLVESPEEKREVLYVLGAMYEREVKAPEKAIATYQRILEFEPDDIQSIQRLDVLFGESEEWHDLLSILEREAELAADPDEAISFKYRIGELFVRYLDDTTRAVEYFKEILSISPDHEPSVKMLEELLEAGAEPMLVAEVLEPLYHDFAEWRKLLGVFEVKLKNTDDAWQKVELYHQMAQMLESELHLDSATEAFDMYARALAEDNINEDTLTHLENLAHQTGRWEDLAKLLDTELEEVVEVERAVQLGLRCGAIYEEKLDKPEDAVSRYQKVFEFDSENRPAIIRLDKLFQIQERWEDLAQILQQEALIADDPSQSLEIQFRQGQLYQQEINDIDKAVEIYRDILSAEPAHEQASAALEMLFAEGVKRQEIAEILEPLYRMQSEWTRLVSLYEAQLEELTEAADRVPMLQRIAEIQEEKALDSSEAFNWYCRAFAEDPFDERSGEEIERLAASTDAWTETADLYKDLFAKFEDKEVKIFCAKRLARVCEEELHEIAPAEEAYRNCLELGGDDLVVLKSLDRIYTQYMEWERLVNILETMAEVVSGDDEKVDCIFRMGSVYESQLDEVENARQCFHRVVDDLEPSHKESLEHLETIYADNELWAELYDIYSRMRDATESEASQADLFAKMATIMGECLDDVPKAIEMWGNVIDIRGEDASALEALGDLYSKQENWNELVDVLERAVTIAEDEEQRIRLYSQLGLVWGECLERDRSALDNWENVLSIDPENIPALKAIAKINEANQDWGPLIETLERIIEVGAAVFEVEELKSYYSKLGTIFAETMEQSMDAIEAWQHANEVDPSDRAPIAALEKLYGDQAMWEEMVDLLGRKAEILDGDEQIDAWLEQAKAYEEKLERPLDAKAPYSQILSVAPVHVLAFEKLVEIQTEEKTWEELIQLYDRRLEYVGDLDERGKLYRAVAVIYEDKLDQAENAFVIISSAFKEDYSNEETATHLERLASVTGQWEGLINSCNQVLQAVDDKNVKIELCLKIGKWHSLTGQPEYGIQYYQEVLRLDQENVSALRQMGDLYRSFKQWSELVDCLGRAVDFETEDEKRKDLYVELGEIYEEYLQDIPEARKAYKAALEIDPSLERATNALERILGAAENWKELIPILESKLEVLSEPDDIISARMRIGEIQEEKLNDFQAAIDEYRMAIEIDSSFMPGLRGLERLYGSMERWQDLIDILEMQLEYAASERERIDLLTRIAEMLVKEFVKPDKAAERYEQIIEIDPGHESSLEALEELYTKLGQWQDLIGTLERHIDSKTDRTEKIDLYKHMAKVYAIELDDADRAIDAYTEILDIDPDDEEALDELAKLQTQREDWVAAHDTLKKLAIVIDDVDRKVDLYYRLGKLNEDSLMDRVTAVEHFRSAVDIEPGHLPSLESLRKIHLDEAEWLDASRVLEAEQEYVDKARVKSQLQFELGQLLADKLDDKDTANTWYEEALKSDPDNQDAATPLVDVYMEEERWEEAEQLLDMLVRLGTKRPASEMQPIQRKLGDVAEKRGNMEKAIKAFQAAYEADTQHLSTVLALANAHFVHEDWDKAFKFYQMVLVHHRDKQGKDEIVDIYYRLGHIKAQLKERRKALNLFDKALEAEPHHRKTLEEVIELHAEQKNFDQVIHYKKVLMESVEEIERFELLSEIGDIWQGKLKNPQKAISSYVEALDIKPDHRPLLHKVLPLYQMTKQWQKVVEVIKQVTDMEEDGIKLGRLFYTMGAIYRDEIKSFEDAVDCFNKSLDASLENLKPFEAIDKILTQRKDWKNLERSYRKMLHRIAGKGNEQLEVSLWHFLGEIYRSRLNSYENAAEAFRMAAKLEPDNAMRHEILAELYVHLGKLDDAVAEHQWLIAKNPYRVDSYKALRKLYFDNHQWDKAWCLCATLSFLKKADEEEQQFYEQYRTKGMVRAQSRLDNERWIKDMFHPDESVYVGKIFEAVTTAVRSLKIQPAKAFGLKKNQKRPPNDTMTFSKTFFYAAQVMNLPMVPELYVQENQTGGLSFAFTEPMASSCGASLLSGYSPQDLLFIVAKHLAYYRPEHYIRWVLPTHGELKMLLLAAIKIGAPDFKLPPDKTGTLQQYVDTLSKNMDPMSVEQLRKMVKAFIKAGANVDIKKWINSLESTACRVGFVLANDLEVAARMIQSETGSIDGVSPKEKIKELVLFSVSENYFRLRETLGINIGT